MAERLMELKNAVIRKFGPVLGYGVLIVGGLSVLSLLGLLLKSLLKLAIVLAAGALVALGISKILERKP